MTSSHAATRAAARAPGRVNLIGDHTDYNDGFAMPMALEATTRTEIQARDDDRLLIASAQYPGERAEFSIGALPDGPQHLWSDCARGMVRELQRDGIRFPGMDVRISGDVPVGAGLSSSAALEIAVGLAALALVGATMEPIALARVAQRSEHAQMGTRSGIMDQIVALLARERHALLLDARTASVETIAFPPQARVVVFNSMVEHALATGAYNERRAQCEAGVAVLARHFPGVRALRDATREQLESVATTMDPVVYRRCRHVIAENARVLDAARALSADDLARFGQLMSASHASLRDDYEVSSRELDTLVELASACEGVYGARMTGGGFGGCAIALVRDDAAERVRSHVCDGYLRATGIAATTCVTAGGAGARVEA